MLTFIRSPWFAGGVTALMASLALIFPSERLWLFEIAATVAFWGIVDWIFGNRDRTGG